eukprot:augustus_masked-scaffold_6-processed-gene-11.7-mRNA-1 protein AED:1.00 eAED:1.00 QI:0/-1/0/0/-1/1/1/0/376
MKCEPLNKFPGIEKLEDLKMLALGNEDTLYHPKRSVKVKKSNSEISKRYRLKQKVLLITEREKSNYLEQEIYWLRVRCHKLKALVRRYEEEKHSLKRAWTSTFLVPQNNTLRYKRAKIVAYRTLLTSTVNISKDLPNYEGTHFFEDIFPVLERVFSEHINFKAQSKYFSTLQHEIKTFRGEGDIKGQMQHELKIRKIPLKVAYVRVGREYENFFHIELNLSLKYNQAMTMHCLNKLIQLRCQKISHTPQYLVDSCVMKLNYDHHRELLNYLNTLSPLNLKSVVIVKLVLIKAVEVIYDCYILFETRDVSSVVLLPFDLMKKNQTFKANESVVCISFEKSKLKGSPTRIKISYFHEEKEQAKDDTVRLLGSLFGGEI